IRPFPCLAFGPDGKSLALGAFDRGARLFDLEASADAAPRVLPNRPPFVLAVALSPDGKTLATGGFRDGVYVWDVTPGKARWSLEGTEVPLWSLGDAGDARKLSLTMSFSPEGR